MSSSKQIETTAALWLARRDRGDWSDVDQTQLDEWLSASTGHRVAYLRLAAAWQQGDRLRALRGGVAPGRIPPSAASRPIRSLIAKRSVVARSAGSRQMRPSWRYGIAVSFMLAGFAIWGLHNAISRGASYQTATGGLEAVPLADGSTVTLNSASEVHVAETERERRVVLARGEAFFEVAKDPRRPFVVRAGDARVTAIGTKFSVLRDGEHLRVVVIEGTVRVDRNIGDTGRPPPTIVAAGHVARSDSDGVLVQETRLSDAEDILSWRSGFLVFHDTSLANAVAEFNRYNTRKIVIDDPAVAAMRIGGNFRSTNVEAFLRLLEAGLPIRADRQENLIVIHGS